MGRNSPESCKEGELGLGQIVTSLPPLVQEGAAASLVTGTRASGSLTAEKSEVYGPVSMDEGVCKCGRREGLSM